MTTTSPPLPGQLASFLYFNHRIPEVYTPSAQVAKATGRVAGGAQAVGEQATEIGGGIGAAAKGTAAGLG